MQGPRQAAGIRWPAFTGPGPIAPAEDIERSRRRPRIEKRNRARATPFSADSNYHSHTNLQACEDYALDTYIPDVHFRMRDRRFDTRKRHKEKDRQARAHFSTEDFRHDPATDRWTAGTPLPPLVACGGTQLTVVSSNSPLPATPYVSPAAGIAGRTVPSLLDRPMVRSIMPAPFAVPW